MTEELYAQKLTEEIDKVSRDFYTDSYPMSIGETVSMYKEGELILRPAFQRFFRWNPYQKTAFIESILLGIPTSSFFVYQDENSKWEIVDGLQRLSTILEFMGELVGENLQKLPPFKLKKTTYLPHLGGVVWQKNDEDKSVHVLPDKLKLVLKRTKLQFMIIQSRSNPDAKFEIFYRLNTGGTFLSVQEARNAWLAVNEINFYNWLEETVKTSDFRELIESIPKSKLSERDDANLFLTYLIASKYDCNISLFIEEIDKFIDKKLFILIKDVRFDKNKEKALFEKLIHIVRSAFEVIEDDGVEGDYAEYLFTNNYFHFTFILLGTKAYINHYERHPETLAKKIIDFTSIYEENKLRKALDFKTIKQFLKGRVYDIFDPTKTFEPIQITNIING